MEETFFGKLPVLSSLGKTKATVAVIKDSENLLEHNIAEDGRAAALLDTTDAEVTAILVRAKVETRSGNDVSGTTDTEGVVGELSAAREDDTDWVTVLVVGSLVAGNTGVIGIGDRGGDVEEGGSSVKNTRNTGTLKSTASNSVAAGGETPEPLAGVDGSVGNIASVQAGVNETEVVNTIWDVLVIPCYSFKTKWWLLTGLVSQSGSEERCFEASLGVGEPSLLLARRDSVDGVKSKTQESRVGGVVDELGRNALGSLNSLGADLEAANADSIGVDIATGATAVTVLDSPRVSAELLGGRALGRVILNLALVLAAGLLGAVNPEVRGTGVEVEGEILGGCSNVNIGDVFTVVGVTGVVRVRTSVLALDLALGLGPALGVTVTAVGLALGANKVEFVLGVVLGLD